MTGKVLRKRCNIAATIPGTWATHCFVPVDTNHLKMFVVSRRVSVINDTL
jgi:hypothetical protein